jgi:hypothetical protein
MASRNFVDCRGVPWRVWSTVPEQSSVLSTQYSSGWLTFESESALRRLAPIPGDWASVSENRLELYCRVAQEVPRHTGPFARMRRDDTTEPADERAGAR